MSLKSPQNHTDFKEWLYLESDGALGIDEQRRLDSHLVSCQECQREKKELNRLESLLNEAVIPVDAELSSRVMERLPEAGWEARPVAGWRLALAVFVLLGAMAALLGLGGEGLSGEVPLAGTALALIGLFQSALLVGSGLLAASWTGVGMALDELFGGSRTAFAVFGVLVFGIDLLFLRLLLRSRARQAESRASSGARQGD